MRNWARVIAAPFLLLLTAGAASADDVILVKGKIEAAEYLDGLLSSAQKSSGVFVDGGNYRIKLAISDVLIGKARKSDLYLTLTITGAPKDDAHPEIFLLAEQQPNGQLQPIDWDFAQNGICIDRYTAISYDIEKEIDAVEKKYPCK